MSKHEKIILNGLSEEELAIKYPLVPENLRPYIARKGRTVSMVDGNGMHKKIQQYKKETLRQMNKKISKHINTQKFNEYFDEHIGVELIGMTLKEVLMSEDEKTENKLKAISEINRYNMIPSQAQEIKHEIDDSFDDDKRARLAELLNKVGK